jgi:hypothetical protein
MPGDPPCILLPVGFENLPFNEQVVGLARHLAAIALGVPWIGELGKEDLIGWFFGALFVTRAGWDGGGLAPSHKSLAAKWQPFIQKHMSRKAKRAIDEVIDNLSLTMDPLAWRKAMVLACWRGAYVISGDWTSTFNFVWRSETDLAGIAPDRIASTMLEHVVLRDLLLWGLSLEPTPLLRAVGHQV